jgi:hypothetical protein
LVLVDSLEEVVSVGAVRLDGMRRAERAEAEQASSAGTSLLVFLLGVIQDQICRSLGLCCCNDDCTPVGLEGLEPAR